MNLKETAQPLWSTASSRRFVCLGDSSPKPRCVERRGELFQTVRLDGIVRPATLDGDKSPAQSDDKSSHSKCWPFTHESSSPEVSFNSVTPSVSIRVHLWRV